MYQKNKDKYIIDLFSGCGGFAEGFKKSGINHIFADYDFWHVKHSKKDLKNTSN